MIALFSGEVQVLRSEATLARQAYADQLQELRRTPSSSPSIVTGNPHLLSTSVRCRDGSREAHRKHSRTDPVLQREDAVLVGRTMRGTFRGEYLAV